VAASISKAIGTMRQEAELLLLDFDGTFYHFTDEFDSHCDDIAAKVLIELGVPGTFEELREKGKESYQKHGSNFTIFHTMGIKIQDWHDIYHCYLEESYISEFHVTARQLRDCTIPIAILSHSNRSWITRMLEKFGLTDVVPHDRIFGLEDVDYLFKHDGEKVYRRVLEALDIAASKAIMVEDSLRNLRPAKKIGMYTVWITHGKEFSQDQHPYVDAAVKRLPDLLQGLT